MDPKKRPGASPDLDDALAGAVRKAEQAVIQRGKGNGDDLELELPEDEPVMSRPTPGALPRPPAGQPRTGAAQPRPAVAPARPGPASPRSPGGKPSGIQILSTQQVASKHPAATPAAAKSAAPKVSSFGEIDLGADEEPLPDLASQGSAAPKLQPRPSKPATLEAPPASGGEGVIGADDGSEPLAREKRPPAERPSIRVHSAEEGNSGKWIKWVVIVLAALAVIAGGVYGILKWREAAEQQRLEELAKLNQGSLDSLKDQAIKKEGVSP